MGIQVVTGSRYLGGLVPLSRPPQLEVSEVSHDLFKLPSRRRVIPIQWLRDSGVSSHEIPDKGEDPFALCNHGERVPLGHALLAVQEVA